MKVGTDPGLASVRVPSGLYSWEEQGMTSVRMAELPHVSSKPGEVASDHMALGSDIYL